MKKLIVLTGLLFLGVGLGYCVTNQPNNIGYVTTDNPLGLYAQTIAQIDLLQPDTTGQIVYCSNCAYATVCISTGANSGRIGAWVAISTGTQNHCK